MLQRITILAGLLVLVGGWIGASGLQGAETGDSGALPPEKKPELRLLVEPDYLPDSVTGLFEKETGIAVRVETVPFDVNVLGSVLSAHGFYDLVIIDDWAVGALVQEKRLEPLDLAKIPNLKNLAPEFLNQPFDPGNRHSVPYLAGVLGIVVNTDLVKSKVRDFPDVFRPEFSGKSCIEDAPVTLARIARRAAGNPSNAALTAKDLEAIRPTVSEWLSRVKKLPTDGIVPAFLNGDVDVGIVWSGEAAALLDADPKFQWIVPAFPTRVFIDSFVIPKQAEHKDEAEAFINFALRPEIGKLIAEAESYLTPNAAARKLLDKKALSNPASRQDIKRIKRIPDPGDCGLERLAIDRWFESLREKRQP